ncbi:MAG: aminoglycoside phosphotransferase family protein [Micromonosporaceae bacterium]|nr:aminoglycoside phosphotransferase family protein [Micromonosporaceae bacterium]
MSVPGIPPADIDIDEHLVRNLIQTAHPDLADLPLRHAATGWDNATYRLGEQLAVRLPRIEAAVPLLRQEQRWLPWLAPRLPVPVPAPVRVGAPGTGFPWPWSIVPWVAGQSAERAPLSSAEAGRFGEFLAAVHQPAPDGFPRNDYRGVPLVNLTDRIEDLLQQLSTVDSPEPPLAAVRDRWRSAVGMPMDVPETCLHGDLHPKNIVVEQGRLAAVLDWGDMTTGDPAADLSAAWMLFPNEVHGQVWAAYHPVSADTLLRARGWAVFFGLNLSAVGLAGDPEFAEIGRQTLARLCSD